MLNKAEKLYPSLTPLAIQIRWKIPTEFPACPDELTDDALLLYESRLSFGSVIARNQFSTSLVVERRLREGDLIVLTRFAGEAVKDCAVAPISIQDGLFHHRSEYTFSSLTVPSNTSAN